MGTRMVAETRWLIFPSNASRLRVFIADDSVIVRQRLVILLGELAWVEVVGQAETVPEAIAGVRGLHPDVVILDIRMPGGSGFEVLQAAKQSQPAPRVVMLTIYSTPAYRNKCLQAGADFFLDKSVEFDLIPEVLARLKPPA